MVLRILTLGTLLLLTLPFSTSAQALGETNPFSLSISPQYPTPFGKATLTPISGEVDITSATMTVRVESKQLYQGNAQALAIPLGAAGTITTVSVTLTANGKSFTKSLSVSPQDVVLVAEPLSSAPPLYPGKSLVPLEGSVRMVAVANIRDAKGRALDPAKLSYSWTVDAVRIASASGLGRDTLVVASPLQYRSREVSVAIQSQDGSAVGGASLSLSAQQPILRLYENDPLLGIRFDRAVTNPLAIPGAEKTLYAMPYSFPTTKGPVALRWFLNGASAQTGHSITLRPTGTGAGTASLSATASAGDTVTAVSALSLTFGAAKGGLGIFGL